MTAVQVAERHPVDAAVARFLAATHASRSPLRVAVALSGGRDSMTLLHALCIARQRAGFELSAVHVHHGVSAHADRWLGFCERQCASRGVPLTAARIQVSRGGGNSLEAALRSERYAALARVDVHTVALAHHADDQAETLLLHLMRGAGPHGLAAMPMQRHTAGPSFARPLLAVRGSLVADYARHHAIEWIEDDSNADTRLRRNALRHDVVPALRMTFPGYPDTLVRAARHQAEAAQLLDDLAEIDAAAVVRRDETFGLTLERAGLARLVARREDRARNLLRWFLRQHDLRAPTAARLGELLAQCTSTRNDARTTLRHDGVEVAVHRGWLVVHASPAPVDYEARWQGEAVLRLPGGTLHARPADGHGIAQHALAAAPLYVRPRQGGERLRVACDRPRQALSAFLHARCTPLWQRSHWPVLWDGAVIVAVPGLGVDPRYAAAPGTAGLALHWEPAR